MTQEEKQLLNGKIMDYKEKYEEKLSKAITLHNLASETSHDDIRMVLEELFDELKESEDERVRKSIIDLVEKQMPKSENKKWMIAWLEKQGKNEKIDEASYRTGIKRVLDNPKSYGLEKQGEKIDVIENFDTEFEKQVSHLIASTINKEYEYTSDFVKWTANVLLNYAKHELEKKDEHKCDCKYAGCHVNNVKRWCHKKQSEILYEKCNIKCSEYLKQGEQKPAWSEEDEKIIKGIIDDIQGRLEDYPIEQLAEIYFKEISWLKSLKERVRPQPKQRWSEEDEKIYQSIMDDTVQENQLNGEQTDWLRDIKYRCFPQPQNTWKPSDEQIKALLKLEEMHVLEHEKNQENAHLYMVIKSLKEQLLKLKEE